MVKVIAAINTKGGSGKSTLVTFIANVLRNTYKKKVSVWNLDQQVHVKVTDEDSPEFMIFDTMGAFADKTSSLLEKMKSDDNAIIIVPVGTGTNDQREYEFVIDSLIRHGVFEKSVFVLNKVRPNSKSVMESKLLLKSLGARVAKSTISLLQDYNRENTSSHRCTNEISKLLNEIMEI